MLVRFEFSPRLSEQTAAPAECPPRRPTPVRVLSDAKLRFLSFTITEPAGYRRSEQVPARGPLPACHHGEPCLASGPPPSRDSWGLSVPRTSSAGEAPQPQPQSGSHSPLLSAHSAGQEQVGTFWEARPHLQAWGAAPRHRHGQRVAGSARGLRASGWWWSGG